MTMISEPEFSYPDAHSIVAEVVSNQLLPGEHGLVRLAVGEVTDLIHPGQFVHLTCAPALILPRPFSILDVDPLQGTIDLFYRIVGRGTEMMARWQGGEQARVLLPVGRSFDWPAADAQVLLIAGGAGLAPLHFLARRLVAQGISTALLWGIETDCPLPTVTASIDPFLGARFSSSPPLALAELESLGVFSRLSAITSYLGRFQGFVTELADHYLAALTEEARGKTRLYTCGPPVMMAAVNQLANRYGLLGQASLEERMACGYGGCAACVAPIRTVDGGWAYQKICTDGPVFSFAEVAWERYGASEQANA